MRRNLKFVTYDNEDVSKLFLEQPSAFSTLQAADLDTAGEFLYVLDGKNIIFVCNMCERWQSWCQRQRHVVNSWNFETIEHPHFCKVLERWIRFCIHVGASEGSIGLPRRMLALNEVGRSSAIHVEAVHGGRDPT